METGKRKPPRLRPGDRVAAVSLSWGGPGAFPHRYLAGKRRLEAEFGLRVVETPHALRDPGWLARHPEARAADLMAAFADDSVRAIFTTIGGDDSIRILPHLDLDAIRAHPKIFLGFSDTTVTHLACHRAGLVSFFGPAIMTSFAENVEMFPYTVDFLRRTLFSSDPIGRIDPSRDGWTAEFLDWAVPEHQERRRKRLPSEPWRFLQGEGVAAGPLLGGTLEVLEWLRGTALWPDREEWKGAILFLETSEEGVPPEALTRALRTLAAMGILSGLAGILIGRPGGPVPPEKFVEYDKAALQVVAAEEGLTRLPIVARMDFGHTDPVFVIPYGVQARIDCDRREITILENAVTD
ncbi:MAG: LD-carboxypeptidase [Acidobacteria bacterium]|nr:LD-carboxypeptidase [Acidobacteriota bacterium]